MPFGTDLQSAHDPYVSNQPFLIEKKTARTFAMTVFKIKFYLKITQRYSPRVSADIADAV